MTPPAQTPAARRTTTRATGGATAARASTAAPRGGGHRSQLRRSITPRSPRRVSGPGAAAAAAVAAPAFAPPIPRAPRPERVTRPRPAPRPSRVPSVRLPDGASLAARLAASVRALPDHALLDRIIRGRVWIPLLGILLAGIVAMQVAVLKLNAGIGISLQRTSALQSQNETLRASVAQLGDDQRIESAAAAQGMVMPQPAQTKFLTPGATTAAAAIRNIHAPSATTFEAQQAAEAAAAGLTSPSGTSTSTPAGNTGTPATPATTAAGSTGTATIPATTAAGNTGTSATAATTPAGNTGTPATAATTAAGNTGTAATAATTAAGNTGTATATATATAAAPASTVPVTGNSGTGAVPTGN